MFSKLFSSTKIVGNRYFTWYLIYWLSLKKEIFFFFRSHHSFGVSSVLFIMCSIPRSILFWMDYLYIPKGMSILHGHRIILHFRIETQCSGGVRILIRGIRLIDTNRLKKVSIDPITEKRERERSIQSKHERERTVIYLGWFLVGRYSQTAQSKKI